MRYLTVAAKYTGSCITDDFHGQVNCRELHVDEELCKELNAWNTAYKVIIPLDMSDREKRFEEINKLDEWGLHLAKKLASVVQGGAKVKYFSEGKLKFLEMQ